MNDNRAAEIYAATDDIARIWASVPELRLGQLISNALHNAGIGYDYFYVKDEVLLAALRSFIKDFPGAAHE